MPPKAPTGHSSVVRSNLPILMVYEDLRNGGIPPDYLRALSASFKPGRVQTVNHLAAPPDKVLTAFGKIAAVCRGRQTTFLVSDREVFIGLATELLLHSLASVAMVDPGQIAQSILSAEVRGSDNPFVSEYLAGMEYLFLDAMASPVITGYLDAVPAAAHRFYGYMKGARYSSQQHLVLDMSDLGSDRGQSNSHKIALLEKVYGKNTADLMLSSASFL